MKFLLSRLLASFFLVFLSTNTAQAGSVVVDIYQSGLNVLVKASGTVTVPTAMSAGGTTLGTQSSITATPSTQIRLSNNNASANSFVVSGCSIPAIGNLTGTQPSSSSTGPLYTYNEANKTIYFPQGVYSAGDEVSIGGASQTFNNTTIAGLSLNVGSYSCTWVNNSYTNSLTINISSSAPSVSAVQAFPTRVLTNNTAAALFTPVTGSGGTAPLSYSISPSLPNGLVISSSTGAITGTPTDISSATTYTVTVADATSASEALVASATVTV